MPTFSDEIEYPEPSEDDLADAHMIDDEPKDDTIDLEDDDYEEDNSALDIDESDSLL